VSKEDEIIIRAQSLERCDQVAVCDKCVVVCPVGERKAP